jgi:hypothetical protein
MYRAALSGVRRTVPGLGDAERATLDAHVGPGRSGPLG